MMSTYGFADDELHPNDGHELWQESHWFMWRDDQQGIAGLHRLGLHPVAGTATFWCAVMTDDGTAYRNLGWALPIQEQPAGSFTVSSAQRLEFVPGDLGNDVRILVDEPGCSVNLRYANHFPMARYLDDGRVPSSGSPDHYEASGDIEGEVVLGDRRFEVRGVAFRDRTWGQRDYSVPLSHRWVAGTFGADFSFSATGVAARDGSYFTDGIVILDGVVHRASSTDIVVYMEGDSFTHRGGAVVMVLPSGREIRLEIETIDATLFSIGDNHLYAEIDSICRVRSEGRVGFCDLEAGFNARQGRELPVLLLRANGVSGLSQRPAFKGSVAASMTHSSDLR
jgi:hypothetical protein